LRRRLSPGLPLSRSPRGGRPVENEKTANKLDCIESLAAGLTWRPLVAEVPLLCVTAFRRFCSEQRTELPWQDRNSRAVRGTQKAFVTYESVELEAYGISDFDGFGDIATLCHTVLQ
jgi:hypothetical protein